MVGSSRESAPSATTSPLPRDVSPYATGSPLPREVSPFAMGSPLPIRRSLLSADGRSLLPSDALARPHTTGGLGRPQTNSGGKSRARAAVFPLGPPLRDRETPSKQEGLPPCQGASRSARGPRGAAYPRTRALYADSRPRTTGQGMAEACKKDTQQYR